MKRWILLLIVVVLIVAGGGYAWWSDVQTVEVAAATRGPIATYIEERAKTRLPHVYRLTMPIDGRILPITLEEGMAVTQGQVVAQVELADLDSAVAEGQERVARLDAMLSELDDNRLEQSALEGSERFLESMDRTVDAAAEKTVASEARYEYAQAELKRVLERRELGAATEPEEDQAKLFEVESLVAQRMDVFTQRATEAVRAAMRIAPRAIREYIDKKQLRRAVLERELAQAEEMLLRLTRDRGRAEICSPVDGVVLMRAVSNERVMGAGTVLLEIGAMGELEVEVEVLSQDAVHIQPGQRVDVYGPTIGAEPIAGLVSRIYPQGFTKISSLGVEQQRVIVVVQFASGVLDGLQSEGRALGVDYRVRTRIFVDERESAVKILRSALFRSPAGSWQVFAVRNGRARLVDVETGLINNEEVQIVGGLDEGDQVILAPEPSVEDGRRVRAR